MQIKQPVILFDGICNLCNGTVDFLIKKDRKKQFRFVALQSEEGKKFVQNFKIPSETDSVILIKQNLIYFESDAIIEIATMLSYPWKLVNFAKIVPKIIRDGVYRSIAKNRYKWFGKTDSCQIITEDNEMIINEEQRTDK